MTYQVEFHPRAKIELRQIRDSIADLGGKEASRRILQAFEGVLTGLAQVPHKGSLRESIAPRLRSVPAAKKGVVTFRVDDVARIVTIVAITYAGQDWMGRVKTRL